MITSVSDVTDPRLFIRINLITETLTWGVVVLPRTHNRCLSPSLDHDRVPPVLLVFPYPRNGSLVKVTTFTTIFVIVLFCLRRFVFPCPTPTLPLPSFRPALLSSHLQVVFSPV